MRREHLFTLRQSVALYREYQRPNRRLRFAAIRTPAKTVTSTTIKTRSDGPCKDFEDKILKSPLANVYTEELVDGVAVTGDGLPCRTAGRHHRLGGRGQITPVPD